MMLHHSLIYLIARGIPGLLSLGAIMLFTRLLPPAEYGQYALVLAGVVMTNMVVFQWLRSSMMRLLVAQQDQAQNLMSVVNTSFGTLMLTTGMVGVVLAVLAPTPYWKLLIVIGVPLLWSLAWVELSLDLARTRLDPATFSLISLVRAACTLIFGSLFAWAGMGAFGLLLGLLLAQVVAMLIAAGRQWNIWSGAEWQRPNPPTLKDLLTYGLPLTMTYVLAVIVDSSDRFFIAHFLGQGAAGIYAAGYDLTQYTLMVLMLVVNLAAYPLVLKALERYGRTTAEERMGESGLLLLGVALPATVGLALLAPQIGSLIFGPDFKESASIMPLIALGILVSGFKSFHLDMAFQLSRQTKFQVLTTLAAALVNTILNITLIPAIGLMGAAWSTLGAFSTGAILSYIWGRREFRVRMPTPELFKIAAATFLMGLAIWPLRGFSGAGWLMVQLALGVLVYILAVLGFNIGNLRTRVGNYLQKRTS